MMVMMVSLQKRPIPILTAMLKATKPKLKVIQKKT
jgi:hypothetical protein